MNVRDITFFNHQAEILQALLQSKEDGSSIGIKSAAFGPETIITAVEDIQFGEGQTMIVLKHYDSSGYMLPCHKLDLSEIEAVCPFTTRFENPILSNLDKDKTWFF